MTLKTRIVILRSHPVPFMTIGICVTRAAREDDAVLRHG